MLAGERSFGTNGKENFLFPLEIMWLTQGSYTATYSHNGCYAMDFQGAQYNSNNQVVRRYHCPYYAPFSCRLVARWGSSSPMVMWQSIDEVNFIDGTTGYATIGFCHDDNVMNFIDIINENKGLGLGARHITISTCGLVPKIKEFARYDKQVNLAISLHAPNNEIRDQIMPINKAYPLEALRDSIKSYIDQTNRRVTFEYILLKDVNDQVTHARQLAHFVRGLNCYVNLIPYNAVDEHGYQQSPKENVEKFHQELLRLKINATKRQEHGGDIDAACGQLRAKKMMKK